MKRAEILEDARVCVCGEREIIEIAYDDELLSELGKTVFETRDKALMALKSMEPKEKSKAHNS